jgi:DNA damage-binding protein 1
VGVLQGSNTADFSVREHNLLQMSFMPAAQSQVEPVVAVIWQSSIKALLLQTRTVSLAAHSFEDRTTAVNVVTPVSDVQIANEDEFDFNDIPYSCPAARHVLPVTSDSVLVIGDEHSVLYTLNRIPTSPRISRASVSSASGTASSPRASAIRRSPQNEMSAPGKRQKSSNTARRSVDGGERWELKPVWRGRQGFGTILA